jgi:hypothetical protein
LSAPRGLARACCFGERLKPVKARHGAFNVFGTPLTEKMFRFPSMLPEVVTDILERIAWSKRLQARCEQERLVQLRRLLYFPQSESRTVLYITALHT